jgi:hypothetical protein
MIADYVRNRSNPQIFSNEIPDYGCGAENSRPSFQFQAMNKLMPGRFMQGGESLIY